MARYLFLLAKTKDRKFKQKTEGKKEKNRRSPLTWATPAQLTSPAGPAREALLSSSSPRAKAARWSGRARRGRHLDAQQLPGRPRTSKSATKTPSTPSLTFPHRRFVQSSPLVFPFFPESVRRAPP